MNRQEKGPARRRASKQRAAAFGQAMQAAMMVGTARRQARLREEREQAARAAPEKLKYHGIDYSLGDGTNTDRETGIHYGVIPMNDLASWAWEELAPEYGEPHCPLGHTLNKDGYEAVIRGGDWDMFITKSPYFTHAQFCSPCAPGACHLGNPVDEGGPRAYCLGREWFEEGKAPYPVYRVDDGSLVPPS